MVWPSQFVSLFKTRVCYSQRYVVTKYGMTGVFFQGLYDLLIGADPRPFRFARAIARDRVSTRASHPTGAFDRSHKTINLLEYRSVILEENR